MTMHSTLGRLNEPRRALCLSLAAVAGILGCSQLTKVSAPDISQPGDFQNPAGAATRAAGALSLFYVEYGLWVMNGGLISDEFIQATGGMGAPDDRILPDGGPMSIQGLSYPGSRTRINALQAIELLQKFAPTPSARIGELFAAVGTIETTMAEDMCSGVPLATLVNGEPVPGPRSTTATLYAHALA